MQFTITSSRPGDRVFLLNHLRLLAPTADVFAGETAESLVILTWATSDSDRVNAVLIDLGVSYTAKLLN